MLICVLLLQLFNYTSVCKRKDVHHNVNYSHLLVVFIKVGQLQAAEAEGAFHLNTT